MKNSRLRKDNTLHSYDDWFSWILKYWDSDIEEHCCKLRTCLEAENTILSIKGFIQSFRSDSLKHIYETVIPKEIRHALGEYYTPDWLATCTNQKIIANILLNRIFAFYERKADIVVGNPPWVNWEYLPQKYKAKSQHLWPEYIRLLLGISDKRFYLDMTYLAHISTTANGERLVAEKREDLIKHSTAWFAGRLSRQGKEEWAKLISEYFVSNDLEQILNAFLSLSEDLVKEIFNNLIAPKEKSILSRLVLS